MRSRAASGVAVGAACLFAAGCGSSPSQQVRAKVQQFGVAIAHHDAKTICTEVFAPSLVKRFASTGLNCQRGLRIFFSGLYHPTLAVGRISVHGSKASAMTLTGASGQTASLRPVVLVNTSNGWRIAALGAPVTSSSGSGGGTGTTGTTTTGGKGATTSGATGKGAPGKRATGKGATGKGATGKGAPGKGAPPKKSSTSTKP